MWPQRALQARGLDVLKRALPLVLGCFGVPPQELLVLRREDPVLRLLRRHEVLEGRARPPPAPALQLKDLLFRAARRPLDPEHRRVDPEAVLRLLERAQINLEGPQRVHGVRSQAPQGVRDVIPLRHGLTSPAALAGLLGDVRLCHAPCVHWQQRPQTPQEPSLHQASTKLARSPLSGAGRPQSFCASVGGGGARPWST